MIPESVSELSFILSKLSLGANGREAAATRNGPLSLNTFGGL